MLQLKHMKKKVLFILLLLSLSFFVGRSSFVFGQTADSIDREIKDLNSQIENQRKQLENVQSQQKQYSSLIKKKEQEQNSLKDQLEILDDRASMVELEIEPGRDGRPERPVHHARRARGDAERAADPVQRGQRHAAGLQLDDGGGDARGRRRRERARAARGPADPESGVLRHLQQPLRQFRAVRNGLPAGGRDRQHADHLPRPMDPEHAAVRGPQERHRHPHDDRGRLDDRQQRHLD